MSYLLKLKQQAQSLREQEQAEAQRREDRHRFYLEAINPAMLRLGKFLAELADNLNFVKPEVKIDYELFAGKKLTGLRHVKYTSYVDSTELCKAIAFVIESEGPKKLELAVDDHKEAEKLTEYLFNRKIQFKQNKVHVGGGLVRCLFEIAPKMTSRFDIGADIENKRIALQISNFSAVGTEKHSLDPAQINDTFLEHFTEFVVRERQPLLQVEIDAELKQRYKAMVDAEQREKEQELSAMEQQTRQQETPRLRSRTSQWFAKSS